MRRIGRWNGAARAGSPIKLSIFTDEIQRGHAPESLAFGTSMVGPVIYTFGSQAQKERFLPRIVDLRDWWCQGFSEPGAGSDLAGLRTKAEREGDGWVINGQKTWTTLAQYADWIFVLARTDACVKKQEGISFFLCDMKIAGRHGAADPDHRRRPRGQRGVLRQRPHPRRKHRRRGEQGLGLRQIPALQRAQRHRPRRRLQGAARQNPPARLAADYGDKPKMDDPLFRMKLAAAEVELKALEMTQMRVIAAIRTAAKGKPNPMSSVLKIKGSELQQATTELLMDVVGPYALPFQPEREDGDRWNEPPIGPDWASTIAPTYFNTRKVSIYGGSNEIQRSIIAKAILGL